MSRGQSPRLAEVYAVGARLQETWRTRTGAYLVEQTCRAAQERKQYLKSPKSTSDDSRSTQPHLPPLRIAAPEREEAKMVTNSQVTSPGTYCPLRKVENSGCNSEDTQPTMGENSSTTRASQGATASPSHSSESQAIVSQARTSPRRAAWRSRLIDTPITMSEEAFRCVVGLTESSSARAEPRHESPSPHLYSSSRGQEVRQVPVSPPEKEKVSAKQQNTKHKLDAIVRLHPMPRPRSPLARPQALLPYNPRRTTKEYREAIKEMDLPRIQPMRPPDASLKGEVDTGLGYGMRNKCAAQLFAFDPINIVLRRRTTNYDNELSATFVSNGILSSKRRPYKPIEK
ncbi:hypothetical protein GMRT_12463 [Giardia muris]|uniref:Uncharacterized protein n=1 Tax=Giardia muris TaxID=5742 RepID=A0A4Z1T343_GIAMU|nr:hypothetical protein GMRT_12463 [Giardia muris]|eukprot:TNJ27467.1 hypothetical protein GMRT_12463 [Giardia muris]